MGNKELKLGTKKLYHIQAYITLSNMGVKHSLLISGLGIIQEALTACDFNVLVSNLTAGLLSNIPKLDTNVSFSKRNLER